MITRQESTAPPEMSRAEILAKLREGVASRTGLTGSDLEEVCQRMELTSTDVLRECLAGDVIGAAIAMAAKRLPTSNTNAKTLPLFGDAPKAMKREEYPD